MSEWCSAGVYRAIARCLRVGLITLHVAGLVSADVGVGGNGRGLAIGGLCRGGSIYIIFLVRSCRNKDREKLGVVGPVVRLVGHIGARGLRKLRFVEKISLTQF